VIKECFKERRKKMDKKIAKEMKLIKEVYAGVAAFLAAAMIAGTFFMHHVPERFFM